jgi:hypothetical protein
VEVVPHDMDLQEGTGAANSGFGEDSAAADSGFEETYAACRLDNCSSLVPEECTSEGSELGGMDTEVDKAHSSDPAARR